MSWTRASVFCIVPKSVFSLTLWLHLLSSWEGSLWFDFVVFLFFIIYYLFCYFFVLLSIIYFVFFLFYCLLFILLFLFLLSIILLFFLKYYKKKIVGLVYVPFAKSTRDGYMQNINEYNVYRQRGCRWLRFLRHSSLASSSWLFLGTFGNFVPLSGYHCLVALSDLWPVTWGEGRRKGSGQTLDRRMGGVGVRGRGLALPLGLG